MPLKPRPLCECAALLALLLAAACPGPERPTRIRCAAPDPDATLPAAGVFRYASPDFTLSGTITFVQQGTRVTVTDTTYDTGRDRALIGTTELQGNRLDITLTPKNGDTNYRAEVSLTFSDAGRRFCLLGFSDTNDDTGGEGSYVGTRIGAAAP